MGLLQSIRGWFTGPAPLEVRGDAPFAVSEAAREALGALAPDRGIHIETVDLGGDGRLVQVVEGPSLGPPPDALAPLPITIGNPDYARLEGRVLDYIDGRWAVTVYLELRARETPNPRSRLYLADRVLSVGKPVFLAPGEGVVDPLAKRVLSVHGVSSAFFRDNTVTIEREEAVPWTEVDRGVDVALREHFLRCGGPIDGGLTDEAEDELLHAVRAVLAERILPAVHRDGGDIELLGVSNGVAKVSMVGACKGCPSSDATLRHGVERTLLEAFPGRLHRVEAV